MKWVLLTHAAVTWYLVGLIWVIQVVQYPSFGLLDASTFATVHAAHVPRITTVVMLPMILELIGAAWLAMNGEVPGPRWLAWVALGLTGVIWASTALLQVPTHDALARQFDPAKVEALVTTNWLRTLAWSARGAITLGWVGALLR